MLNFRFTNLLKLLILKYGIFTSRRTDDRNLKKFFALIKPIKIDQGLIRLGDNSDGGYLVPNDLDGICACFSPGVSGEASFEMSLVERGIPCYLADYSVDGPPLMHHLIHFEKKFLGPANEDEFITLDYWVQKQKILEGDFILQMDIEGGEYGVLLSTPLNMLLKFRILVIEFHGLNAIFNSNGFQLIELTMRKLLENFEIVHIHPNNCAGVVGYGKYLVPPVMEFTFIRKDRVSGSELANNFPHPLDVKNAPGMPDIVLPKCWQG
jgi:hypothetical protein